MEYLREAEKQDIDMLFQWANEISVRKNAFKTDSIAYDEHKKWFHDLLIRDDARQYIYMCDEEPIGQIRITVSGEEAEIDYSIRFEKRCMGYGKKMLQLLGEQVKRDFPQVRKLVAKVKPDNIASQKVFLDMGYIEKYCYYEAEIDKIKNMAKE